MRRCNDEGCEEPHYAQGRCKNTYNRLRSSGALSVVLDPSRNDEDRYLEFVDTSAGPEGCHPWTGSKRGAYGRFTVNRDSVLAHRWAYQHFVGPLAPGEVVRHKKCDNPICQNLLHLEKGTHKDNTQDMIGKGRRPTLRGEEVGNSKLTEDQVREIRASSLRQETLAESYKVSRATISLIKSRKRWAHVI